MAHEGANYFNIPDSVGSIASASLAIRPFTALTFDLFTNWIGFFTTRNRVSPQY
jgi:hypothetical protein